MNESPYSRATDYPAAGDVSLPTEPLRIPAGYGLRLFSPAQRRAALAMPEDEGLYDVLLVWEPPRRGKQYVVSVDVSSGVGKDRSCIDVTRVGDIQQGEEQVAQFVSSQVDPIDLAYVIDPIGRFYKDVRSSLPAMVAIECNGLGLGTQNELQEHVGYHNLFIWQYLDATTPQGRFTTRYGWYTNQRTRPLALGRYFRNLKSVDPNTGQADYQLNSPLTLMELMDFKTPGPLWMAEGDPYDDCVIAGAIGVHVAQTLQSEQREPLAESRRRLHEEKARAERLGQLTNQQVSWLSTDAAVDDMQDAAEEGLAFVDWLDNPDKQHYL